MSSTQVLDGQLQPESCPAPLPAPLPLPSTSSSTESLMHAVAGGVGSALALALTYPLDQLRTFQQVRGASRPVVGGGAVL